MTDRISILPVSVLCHILSFLPTKEAVATSVLSKKWNPLWRSVPTLDFYFNGRSYENKLVKEKYSSFVKRVYEVILSRDLYQPIQAFRLSCSSLSSHCDPINVKILVNAAIQRGVEHLDLTFFGYASDMDMHVNLPSAIFRHRILVVLKLNGLACKSVSAVDLPSLKILHLDRVRFLENRYLTELLSGCPVLEDLATKDLYLDEYSPCYLVEGECKMLSKLVRADIYKRYVPLLTLNNVKFLRIDKGYGASAVRGDYNWDMSNGDDPNPYTKELIPMFHNLIHMELTLFYCTMNWLDIIELLKHCPKLQILVIDQDFWFVDDYEEIDWQYQGSVPKCISLCLKECRINRYKGSEGELRFARYVMRNARHLDKMKICVNADSIRDEKLDKFDMLEELSLCVRRSSTCELSFQIIKKN